MYPQKFFDEIQQCALEDLGLAVLTANGLQHEAVLLELDRRVES